MQPHLRWPTPKWWFLLWGVLQACPTQGSVVLLAQWLPQKLKSPGYPEPYVKGQESSTDIEAPEGYAVRLLFQDFDLEPSPDCERDSVTVSWVGFWRDSEWGGPLLEPQGSGRGPGPETRGLPRRPDLPAEAPCLPVHPAVWAPPAREKAASSMLYACTVGLRSWMFSSVKSLSHVTLFATPWTAARQTSLSVTNCRSLLKLISIESVIPSNHLILCCPLLLLPSIFPSISILSNESVLCIRWPKYWSFIISPSNEYSGLISFRINWLDLLAVQFSNTTVQKHQFFGAQPFFTVQLSYPYMTTGKNHSFD